MMKLMPFAFLLVFGLSTALSAQEDPYETNVFYDGYIVHKDGTKERGFIQYLYEADRYEKVVFRKEQGGKKLKYKTKDLDGYMVAEKTYKAVEYDDVIGKGRKFLAVDKEGCINVYYYTQRDDDGSWSVINVFENDKTAVNYQKFALNFAKKMAEFVEEDAELSAKVAEKEKGYGMLQMHDIIEEYNERCENR